MPELNKDEYLILKALKDAYIKNIGCSAEERLWAPNQWEPVDRSQWLAECELRGIVGSQIPDQRFHEALLAILKTLEAVEQRTFSGIDPSRGKEPFALSVELLSVKYLDESFNVVDTLRCRADQVPIAIHSHARIRINQKGFQLLREFERSKEGLEYLNAKTAQGEAEKIASETVKKTGSSRARKSPEEVDHLLASFLTQHHGYETLKLRNQAAATWNELLHGTKLRRSTLSNALDRAFAHFDGTAFEKYRKACSNAGRGIALYLIKVNGDQIPPRTGGHSQEPADDDAM